MNDGLFRLLFSFMFAIPWYMYAYTTRRGDQSFDEWKKEYLTGTLLAIFICWVSQFIPFMEWLYKASPPFSGFFMSLLLIHSAHWIYRDWLDYEISKEDHP